MERIAQASIHGFDLSRHISLRSLEVRVDSIFRGFDLEKLLSTITSPVFSEIVLVFAEDGTRWPSLGLGLIARELRGMYEIRQFRLGYCLETTGHLMSDHLRALTQSTQAEVADGYYDFLPSPCWKITFS